MERSRPFHPQGVGGAELFADPVARTAAYHDARARELDRQARAASSAALADALRCVSGRHRATASALCVAGEPAARRLVVRSRARAGAFRAFARRVGAALGLSGRRGALDLGEQ
jgi:hypothetical protein